MGESTDPADGRTEEPKGGRPGPADHGGEGGMATRENAPELTEPPSTTADTGGTRGRPDRQRPTRERRPR
ncbi:hypothetical protein [Mycolicibacterium vanbaalenii]|uniref:hypothetical protein n=1 Tax=Mycolicibacterium vanbaalenii TaxID=110539 RepID=UPI001330E7F2